MTHAGRRPVPRRALLLLPGGVALLTGLATALHLLGLPAPITADRLVDAHGILMVLGFVGTLVALERAVAARHPAAYLAPAALGLGALALLAPLPRSVGQGLLVAGTLGLLLVYVPLWRRQPATPTAIQAVGAVCATGAAWLWAAGVAVPDLLPWLVGFVVLTIAGERTELARLDLAGGTERTAFALALGYVLAAGTALLTPPVGYPIVGAILVALAVVLGARDVARRTVRSCGLPRFAAAAMLAGYGWLALAGLLWVAPVLGGSPAVLPTSGATYDAVVHALFLGFTLSMIMAHAPVILPAVLRRPLPYRAVMWAPLGLLHASLLVRVVGGDLADLPLLVQIGGAANVVAVLVFAGTALWAQRTAASRPTPLER